MAGAFDDAFAELRAIMLRSAPGMQIARDRPGDLLLLAPWPHPLTPKEPMMFGMVRTGKAYVSYHLMPLYTNAALQGLVPEALARRKQGKTCFNFKRVEPGRFAELEALTAACAKGWAKPLVL